MVVLRTDETGYFYAYDPTKGMLSVFQPDGQLSGQYINIKLLNDFVPMGNSLVYEDYESGHLYRYSFSDRVAHLLTPTISSFIPRLEYCGWLEAIDSGRDISRIGTTTTILACSHKTHINQRDICMLTLFDVFTVQRTDIAWAPCRPGSSGWTGVIAGTDGKIYTTGWESMTWYAQIGLPTPTPPASEPPNGGEFQYDPVTGIWQMIPIPSNRTLRGVLVAVDEDSNLYFSHRENTNPIPLQITKITPSGTVAWIVNQDELGNVYELAGVVGQGRLVLVSNVPSETSNAQVEIASVQVPALTPTP